MCCLQSAMAGEYGSFNTQAVPASVDIMGFSCRHAPTPTHPAGHHSPLLIFASPIQHCCADAHVLPLNCSSVVFCHQACISQSSCQAASTNRCLHGGPHSTLITGRQRCRFPESESPTGFWENLVSGTDMVTENDRRWPVGLHGTPGRFGKLIEYHLFDAPFFSVHGKQASVGCCRTVMTHAERQILQCLEPNPKTLSAH